MIYARHCIHRHPWHDLLLVGLILTGCQSAADPLPYRNLNATYVGVDVCASCHADKALTFEASQMGRSWEPATAANSAADFEQAAPVYDEYRDLHYLALAHEDSLYIMEYRLSGDDTTHKRIEKIDYIVGSGHHTNSHIMDVGGYLYQMPLTWYVQAGRWDLPPGYKGRGNLRFDRPIRTKCITCHNGMPSIVEGSYNKYDAVPHGIDCERCHGAGSVHVEAMRAGEAVDVATEIDYTIVNPAKLPVDRQFNICQGCHVQGAAVPREGKTFADFRPGMALTDIENVFWPRFADSLHQFVMASHADRLMQSACWRESEDAAPLTCVTCHDPHVPIESLGSDHYEQACLSCHEVPAHTEAVTGSCVSCHMPVSGSSDIPHVQITDHLIRVPDSAASMILAKQAPGARFVRMASLLDPSPSHKELARGYLTYYEEVTNHPGFLDSAAVHLRRAQEQSSLDDVAAPLVRMHYLAQDYASITRIARQLREVRDAETAYRIGDAYLATNNPGAALAHLENAVRLAPARLDFRRRLASGYAHLNRYGEALSLLSEVLQDNPKYAEAMSDRGYMHVVLRDFERAESDLQAAIALNPDLEAALANLASLYYNTNQLPKARPLVARLLVLNGTNIQYHQLWELVN